MGTYINPPQKVQQVGRPLSGETFEALTAQLNWDEALFGLYDRYVFQNAPHLYSPREFEEFESQYRNGIVQRIGFYAVPRTEMESAY